MSIKQLPEEVAAQIKSSVTISSLNSVVFGLAKNSLDADASKLNISVDYRRGNCSVEDDGHGIPPSSFQQDGLGKLYYTSKYPPSPSRYGKHGTFLASVAALSLLSVTSHHTEYSSHNSLTIHNSKIIARNTPALPDQRLLTFPQGTRVMVRDLFGAMPVRVKQRALDFEKSGSTKHLDQLVPSLVALLMSWPGEASISLRDANNHQTLTLRTTEPGKRQSSRSRTRSSLVLSRLPRLLAQASLHDGAAMESWVPIRASSPGVSISGCVCLIPVATKRLQFLAVGIEPLINKYGSNVLYEEINRVFANSAFGVTDGEDGEDTEEKDDVPKARDLKSRKGVDRWPIFCLQISLLDESLESRPGLEDIFDGRSQSLTMIAELLRIMSFEFLKKHNFRPRSGGSAQGPEGADSETSASSRDHTPVSQSQSIAGSRVSGARDRSNNRTKSSRRSEAARRPENRPESPFDVWSRVKTGRSLAAMPKIPRDTTPTSSEPVRRDCTDDKPRIPGYAAHSPTQATAPSLIGTSGQLLRKPFPDARADEGIERVQSNTLRLDPSIRTQPHVSPHEQDEALVWVDPMANIRLRADGKSTNVVSASAGARKLGLQVPKNQHKEEGTTQGASWIEDILSTWENPAFCPTEPPIPRLSGISEGLTPQGDNGDRRSAAINSLSFGNAEAATSIDLLSQISRTALQKAEIIGQVDLKFILTKVPLGNLDRTHSLSRSECDQRPLLVLIDQHAADERCRVESLMKSYFSQESGSGPWNVQIEGLEKPLVFELPSKDGHLLQKHQKRFEYWGIVFKLAFSNEANREGKQRSNVKVEVQALPPSILERCRLEPRLLVDLLRKEVWKLYDEPSLVVNPERNRLEELGGLDWVRMFHGCPQGILDLINSRSCRSAIMFNDPLTVEQCNDLVKRLTDCAFPFQCAHGRPSMVPLVDLGNQPALGFTDAKGSGGMTLLEELKAWSVDV